MTTAPCALDSEGWVECWRSDEWGDNPSDDYDLEHNAVIPVNPVPMRLIYAPDSYTVWGVERDSGRSTNWFCADATDYWCTPPEMENAVNIGMTCGLESDGQVNCVQSLGEDVFGQVRLLDNQHESAVALAPDGRLAAYGYGATVDEHLPQPERITHAKLFRYSACVRYDSGEVLCYGDGPEIGGSPTALFPDPPYRSIEAGGLTSICAVRMDWTIDCRTFRRVLENGSLVERVVTETVNWGPLRDLSVHSHQWTSGGYASVCAILEDNAIRCFGRRYDDNPDIHDKLPGPTE
ncbi:MAG: hypothetical protein H6737_17725 [Alphaproteobacteria bacterium]|nr:hypothetical protein [Alphaproteobacteria bacterium]